MLQYTTSQCTKNSNYVRSTVPDCPVNDLTDVTGWEVGVSANGKIRWMLNNYGLTSNQFPEWTTGYWKVSNSTVCICFSQKTRLIRTSKGQRTAMYIPLLRRSNYMWNHAASGWSASKLWVGICDHHAAYLFEGRPASLVQSGNILFWRQFTV